MSKDKVMWEGDWRTLEDKVCPGNVEVWDQTIGCPECRMNLWHLPDSPEFWPAWFKNPPPDDWWSRWNNKETRDKDINPYKPYADLFFKLHPFGFNDAHDPGDEHVQRD